MRRRELLHWATAPLLPMVPAVGGVFGAQHAMAQESNWPTRSVKVVVPYSPGGSADTLGRLVTTGLTEEFKQPFVIENRGGAGGIIGSQMVAKSAPDGYTLVVSGIGSHIIAPSENPKAFDPIKDFTHIAILGGPPIALAINASLPINDLKGFIEYAGKQNGGLSWGSPGKGTHGYLIGESFEAATKTRLEHVGYKGAAPAMTDLIAGHISASFTTLSTASPHIQAGRLKLIATTGSKRLKEFPDVPTFAELGYPKLTSTTWFSLSGPAGMPKAMVERINVAVRKIMHSPHATEQLAKVSMETFDWDVPRFNRYFEGELRRWAPMVSAVQQAD